MKDYTSTEPVFSESIPVVEEDDLVNAENNNAAAIQLLQNILVLAAAKVDKEEGKSLVSDSERNLWNGTYQQATGYTDQKISDLIGGAPSTLDTLGEIAKAMADNADVVEALNTAIGSKANQIEMESLLGTKLDKTGDSKDNSITFNSSDTTTSSAWTEVAVLKSGETHKSFAQKVSTMFKNLRYLWKILGSTSISGIGDGTVTGAVNALNTGLGNKASASHSHSEYYPKTGGTVNGTVNAGGKAEMWTDDEGGNFGLKAPDGTVWEIDAHNGNLRIFTYANNVKTGIIIDKMGKVTFPGGTSVPWDYITDKPASYPPASHKHSWSELESVPDIGGSVRVYAGYIGYNNSIYGQAFSMGIGNGIYIIHAQGKQVAAGSDSTFDWGFNLTGLLSMLKLPADTAYYAGTWTAWNSDGQLITDCVGMGAGFSEKTVSGNRVLMPGRYYNAAGAYGGLLNTSALGQNGTVWNAEIVVGK